MTKEQFIEVYKNNITRDGSDRLIEFLISKSDFFVAPASTRFHGNYKGGLLDHSMNVYECLKGFLESDYVKNNYNWNYSNETIAIVALLHDICKVNCYKVSMRNKKDENGQWIKVPYYTFEDSLPYGHGEKSVYMISGYMRLTREEAFAIRYHMGFSEEKNTNNVGKAFEMFPLAFALSTADMLATNYKDKKVSE